MYYLRGQSKMRTGNPGPETHDSRIPEPGPRIQDLDPRLRTLKSGTQGL